MREGKTNYVATACFRDVTGGQPTEPTEFFGLYEGEFKPKRRKTNAAAAAEKKEEKSSPPTKKERAAAEKIAKEQIREEKAAAKAEKEGK